MCARDRRPAGAGGALTVAHGAGAGRRYDLLEGWRAVAIILVVASHAAYVWFPLEDAFRLRVASALGPLGVCLFFGISGFVLYKPFIERRAGGARFNTYLSRFAVRRAARILPGYWVALTVLAAWPGLLQVFSSDWPAYYGLGQIYSAQWAYGGLGPAWTLCVEVTFYLTLPLFAFVMRRRGAGTGRPGGARLELLTLAALSVASVAVRGLDWGLLGNPVHPVANSLAGTLSWFAGGMALAVAVASPGVAVVRWLEAVGRRWAMAWSAAAALFGVRLLVMEAGGNIPVTASGHVPRVMFEWVLYAAIGLLLIAPAVYAERAPVVRALLGNRVMVWIGLVSYGIYLWHLPLLGEVRQWEWVAAFPAPVVAFTAASLALVTAFGALSFYAIERPAQRWSGGGRARLKDGGEAAVPALSRA